MTLNKLKKLYLKEEIDKEEYISKMMNIHKVLFEYSEFIKNTNVESIEITPNRVVATTKQNIKIICDKNDLRSVPIETINFGSYEPNEMQMALSLLKQGDHILDIGANLGLYSLYFSKHVKNVHINSFEPIKKTYDYLVSNIKLNNVSNINAYNLGFSNEIGKKVFYYTPEESGSASMVNLKEENKAEKVPCKVTRLDSFVKSKRIKVDFIKCDVEGSELLVFNGGKKTIEKFKPIILTEMLRKWSAKFNYHPNDLIELLKNTGYLCYTVKNGKLKVFREMKETTTETNFFFLHKQKHSLKIKTFCN